jgi:hypothetical protein
MNKAKRCRSVMLSASVAALGATGPVPLRARRASCRSRRSRSRSSPRPRAECGATRVVIEGNWAG